MQLALRTPARPIPTWQKIGLGDSNINPTTIWTPQGGFTSSSWGAPAAAVYQAPTLIPPPACAQGPTADTSECQAQVRAVEQQNFQLRNNANYSVDLANCLATVPTPPDCYQRTFGLTPAGGFTSDAQTQGPQLYQDANGNFVTVTPGMISPLATAPPGPGSGSAGNAKLTFTNLTSGNNSSFKVGDRWQLTITGAAVNSPVTVNGGMNGANVLSSQGSTDGNGNFTLNGQMTQDQVGQWSETWRVNNQIVQSFTFSVVPSGSVVAGGSAATGGTGQTVPKTTQNFLSGSSVSIGGTSVPVWALGLAAVAVFFMVKK